MPLLKCPECGADVSTRAARCPQCGAPLNREETGAALPEESTPEVTLTATAPPAPPQVAPPTAVPPPQNPPQPMYAPQPPRRGGNTLVIVLLVVLILLVVGGLLYFIFGRDKGAAADKGSVDTVVSVQQTVAPAAQQAAPEPAVPAGPQRNPDQLNQALHLEGSVGKYGVVMDMSITDGVINGSYYYTRYGTKNRLYISGTYDPKTQAMQFYELDKNDGYTGDFQGTFDGLTFTGVMSAYGNGRTFSTKLSKTQ